MCESSRRLGEANAIGPFFKAGSWISDEIAGKMRTDLATEVGSLGKS